MFRNAIGRGKSKAPFQVTGYHRNPVVVKFPKPRDININMMPFVRRDEESVPEDYRHYWEIIDLCDSGMGALYKKGYDDGEIAYLTIQESLVSANESQRRPGIHTDCSGVMLNPASHETMKIGWGIGEHKEDYFSGGME
jgi:hypothetical protein